MPDYTLASVMSTTNQPIKVKNHGKKRGKPVVTAKKRARKHHLNLSLSEQAGEILRAARESSGFSQTVLVEQAAIEYIGPKWLK